MLVDQQLERIQLRRPAEAVVVRGCGQAEVRALLTVLQVTPYLHCNARFDMPSRESRRSAAR